MTSPDRDILVMIFTGETGTFKTTYAKSYALNQNKSICISSSSNDPIQDYKGEDVLVLDDLRDDAFKFHDFLKVLDNHTQSTISSRYSNKAFIGDTIIITSSQPLSDWYFDIKKEEKEQLYRRIKIQMQFTKENITVFEWSDIAHKYLLQGSLPNISTFSPEASKKYSLGVLKAMGVSEDALNEFEKIDLTAFNGYEVGELSNMTDEQLKLIKDNFDRSKGIKK